METVTTTNYSKILIPIDERYHEITERNFTPWPKHTCNWSCYCMYQSIKQYCTYAVKTSGKKMMTLFDVGTDIRTFWILWADRNAAYWSCFLLSSILLPYIVFWGSSFNFENATRSHTEFNERKAKTCSEKCTKLFYYFLTFPIIGLIVTFVQICMWWTVEIILGLFWQRKHQECVNNVERRENARLTKEMSDEDRTLFRSLPMFPSVNAARYLTIIELFFESIPQCLLQIYIYLQGTSKYFTLQDIVLSVSASILNIIMNIVSITRDAHSVGMSLADYIVYFMGDRIGDMLISMVPIQKTIASRKQNVCNLTGFPSIYITDVASSLTSLIEFIDKPNTLKTIILPTLHTNIPNTKLEEMLYLLAIARYKENIHITFLENVISNNMYKYLVLSEHFIRYSEDSNRKQTDEICLCVDNCQDFLNIIQCCNVKAGNVICGEKEITIDQSIYQESKKKLCCACFTVCVSNKNLDVVNREDSFSTERRQKLITILRYLWPILKCKDKHQIQPRIANIMMIYMLVGDYHILSSVYNVLSTKYDVSVLKLMINGLSAMESIRRQSRAVSFHEIDEDATKERVLGYEIILKDILNKTDGEGKTMV